MGYWNVPLHFFEDLKTSVRGETSFTCRVGGCLSVVPVFGYMVWGWVGR
jgi:hypothetical protein